MKRLKDRIPLATVYIVIWVIVAFFTQSLLAILRQHDADKRRNANHNPVAVKEKR